MIRFTRRGLTISVACAAIAAASYCDINAFWRKTAGLGRLQVVPALVDLGLIDDRSTHDVVLRVENGTSSDVKLSHFLVSCGCLRVQAELPRTVPARSDVNLRTMITVNSKKQFFEQSVRLGLADSRLEIFGFSVVGQVRQKMLPVFDPDTVEFGRFGEWDSKPMKLECAYYGNEHCEIKSLRCSVRGIVCQLEGSAIYPTGTWRRSVNLWVSDLLPAGPFEGEVVCETSTGTVAVPVRGEKRSGNVFSIEPLIALTELSSGKVETKAITLGHRPGTSIQIENITEEGCAVKLLSTRSIAPDRVELTIQLSPVRRLAPEHVPLEIRLAGATNPIKVDSVVLRDSGLFHDSASAQLKSIHRAP